MLDEHSEPLLSALGGLPYGLRSEIEADLDNWKMNGITPFFVFDGLYIIGQEDMALRIAKEATRRSDKAWESYQNAQTEQQLKDAVKGFGELGTYYRATTGTFMYLMLMENRCNSAEDVLSLLSGDSS
jgi:hypothetical protein